MKTIQIGLLFLGFNTAFAADQVAKETMTPPPFEESLTLTDIKPIESNKTTSISTSPNTSAPTPTTPVNNSPPTIQNSPQTTPGSPMVQPPNSTPSY